MKEQVVENAPKKIKHIRFGVLSPQEMMKIAEVEITQRDLYSIPERLPIRNGVLDPRLGTSNKDGYCETCSQKMADCSGHYGFMKLILPIFHIGYFRAVITVLQSICKSCSRVMLEEADRRIYLKKLRAPNLENVQRAKIIKAISDKCKKVVYCTYCGNTNGTVKKVATLKIVHEKFRAKRTAEEQEQFKKTFESAISFQPEIKGHLNKAQDDLNPLKVLQLFERIRSEDCELLGLDPEQGRPELYIWQYLPVPPVCIRPSVAQDGASTEDDLTAKMTEIIWTNAIIRNGLERGQTVASLMEQWEYLQLSAAVYINSELPGVPSANSKPIRGLCQRLKGKQGRFRGNLSGKRVDFSSRTVISPDPNMRIDQVAVPERVAKILTYPERVFEHNIKRLREAVCNGTDKHPGANYVQSQTGFKRYLKFGDRERIAAELKVGDIVERHLADGDIVLFNRQPSLHRLSIMAHFAKIMPWRTFRFNECVCTPYNADFDGDEMNMHVPQTEEARTEAIELMGVKNNLVTPRNGELLIAATQDFITASYLLSKKDCFYNRAQFIQVVSMMCDANLKITLPSPVILKPERLWTGKQVFNLLFRPSNESPVMVNLETKTRSFQKPKNPDVSRAPELCPADGYLLIRNSEIMCGLVDKSVVGGDKGGVFYTVLRDYGSVEAANCMNRLAKLCARWLANKGFSIGIEDVTPGERLRNIKDKIVADAYHKCDMIIEQYKTGKLETLPGYNEEQTLESKISGVLSDVRGELGRICMSELNMHNAPLIMAMCGSKGSQINVSQMVSVVGQQIISGSRIPDGFQDRSLPHFLKHSKTPAAKGFVRNSFYSGLTPTEFLFHAISGREGLVDTAVKTAETGYMQRRLMKALEDLTSQYDFSVRNSVGGVVQFTYGDDGLDPMLLEGDGQPVHFERNLRHAKSIITADKSDGLLPWQVDAITLRETSLEAWTKNCHPSYIENVQVFIRDFITLPMAKVRKEYGMIECLKQPDEDYMDVDLDKDIPSTAKTIFRNRLLFSETQLRKFLDICLMKYMKAKIEPGTAVGAVGAQSIGEPGTQMTLKTFHFAGVASMNVTLGVPRIKEIINAAKIINTPIMDCKLVSDSDQKAARIVKGRIEKTVLDDVAEYIEEVYTPNECYIVLKIDIDAINRLQLETDVYQIANAISFAPKLKIGESNVRVDKPDRIRVYVSPTKDSSVLYYNIKSLKRALPKIIIKGIPTVNRAIITEAEKGKDIGKSEEKSTNRLFVEGYGLREVMTTDGIVGTHTVSNHIMEVEKVLGIEAARKTIINQIQYTMKEHGMTIDPRHVMLLGDTMTYKGEVLGITRFGISKMKDSVLMLASFEKTTDHLFEASFYSKRDTIDGVSEQIIMGIQTQIGTGLFKLIRRGNAAETIPPPRKLLFDCDLV